jgi:hypothetical protein
MPQRTNDFQTLISVITRQLLPTNAKVRSSVLLKEAIIETEREIDVLVEYSAGPHPFVIGIECRDEARRSDVNWIEQIHGKHPRLGINKSVAVSKRGFSRPAAALADSLGIQTLTLDEAVDFDWTLLVKNLRGIIFDTTAGPELEDLWVVLGGECADVDLSSISQPKDIPVFGPDGTCLGTAAEVAILLLRQPDTQRRVRQRTWPLGETRERWRIPAPSGTYALLPSGERVSVAGLVLQVLVTRSEVVAPLSPAGYGEARVTTGRAIQFGNRFTVSVAETPDGTGSLAVLREPESGGQNGRKPRNSRRRPSAVGGASSESLEPGDRSGDNAAGAGGES